MSRKAMRAWKCPQGHVLGMIRPDSKPPMLLLYRHAVDPSAVPHARGEVIGQLFGAMREIRCDVCGEVREWKARRQATLSQ